MKKLKDGDGITINGREYAFGTVNGYRARYKDEPKDDNYAWLNACAAVIDGNRERAEYNRSLRDAMPTLGWYEAIEVEDLGVYAVCPPNKSRGMMLDGDHPVLMPLQGQNASPQAAKRCRMSAAADAKRPMPRYDNS